MGNEQEWQPCDGRDAINFIRNGERYAGSGRPPTDAEMEQAEAYILDGLRERDELRRRYEEIKGEAGALRSRLAEYGWPDNPMMTRREVLEYAALRASVWGVNVRDEDGRVLVDYLLDSHVVREILPVLGEVSRQGAQDLSDELALAEQREREEQGNDG